MVMKFITKAALLLTITLPVALTGNAAECQFKFCRYQQTVGTTIRVITDENRIRLGTLYTPIPGERTQIRDNNLKILGYIEPSGRITNPHRQKVGSIEELIK